MTGMKQGAWSSGGIREASAWQRLLTSSYKKALFRGRCWARAENFKSGRFCVRHSAVSLDCLLDARCGFLQVVKVHGRMELDMGIESQKPRFRHGGDLRRILQVEKMNPVLLPLSAAK